MRQHETWTGAANPGDKTFGVGSVEGSVFTVSLIIKWMGYKLDVFSFQINFGVTCDDLVFVELRISLTKYFYVFFKVTTLALVKSQNHSLISDAASGWSLAHPKFGVSAFSTQGGRLYKPHYCLPTRICKPSGISAYFIEK